MLRQFTGFLLLASFRRELRLATNDIDANDRRWLATYLSSMMLCSGEFEQVRCDEQRPTHHSRTSLFLGPKVEEVGAALLECWLEAKWGAKTGYIDRSALEFIDTELWKLLARTLGSDAVARLRNSASQRPLTRPPPPMTIQASL